MGNNIEELRRILFGDIRGVKDGTLDIEKAKAIDALSQTIIHSARVEIDYIRSTNGAGGTRFMLGDATAKDEPEETEDDIDERDLTEDQKELLALEGQKDSRTESYVHLRGQPIKRAIG